MKRSVSEHVERQEQIKRLQKLFPNKQLVEVINGGNGAYCANGVIGIIFPKNGNIIQKEKEKHSSNLPYSSWNYHGNGMTTLMLSNNYMIKSYDFESGKFEFYGLCDGNEIKKVENESKEKRKILARLRSLQNFAKKHNIYTEEVQPKPKALDHFKTSFEALVFFLNQKKTGEEVSRKEIMKFMIEGQMIATSELTVDNYRRTLTAAGYLGEVKRGVYRMLVTIPDTLTTSKLNQMAYPR